MVRIVVHMCEIAASILMAGLVAVTFVDVIGRQFGYPLGFAYEFTKIGVGALFYTVLPIVILHRAHITVDLLSFAPTSRAGRAVQFIADLLIAAGVIWIVYLLWGQAQTHSTYGTRFMFTNWRMDLVVYGMSAMTAVAAIFAVRNLFQRRSPEHGPETPET